MFHGSIPGPMRQIVHETVRQWPNASGVWVACCGNFTIERSIADLRIPMHSSDVTIFSSAAGRWLAGEPTRVYPRDATIEAMPWFTDVLDDGVGTVAALMLGTRFLGSWKKAQAGHPFHARNVDSYRRQWEKVHADTVDKITKNRITLASYDAEDVMTWIDKVPEDGTLCSFPPFFAGDYTNMFAPLDAHFEWDPPPFTELGHDDKDVLLERLLDRPQWVVGLHEERPELADHLRGRVQTANRGVPIYVYASGGPTRVVIPQQLTEPVKAPRLGPTADIEGPLRLVPLTSGQFSTLRSQYMSRHIKPGSPALAVAVVCDTGVIGCFAYSPPKYTPGELYMLSDFPVAPTKWKHLAKLVIAAALSSEAKRLAERSMSMRLTSLLTTAFTQRPASMKYRSIMKLRSRKEDPPNSEYRYQLNYAAPLGAWTLEEGLAMWRKRWGATPEGGTS